MQEEPGIGGGTVKSIPDVFVISRGEALLTKEDTVRSRGQEVQMNPSLVLS
jgi:hypothetical protein